MTPNNSFTNKEITDLLYTKVISLKRSKKIDTNHLINDLSFILDEVSIRLSIANKKGFRETVISFFDMFEYNNIEESFTDVNDQYKSYFGEFMYKDFESFKDELKIE